MINVYEVELNLFERATGKKSIVTRTEHAYGVLDACIQASCNHGATIDHSAYVVTLRHISPPAHLIAQCDMFLAGEIALAVKRAIEKV